MAAEPGRAGELGPVPGGQVHVLDVVDACELRHIRVVGLDPRSELGGRELTGDWFYLLTSIRWVPHGFPKGRGQHSGYDDRRPTTGA